MEGHSRPGWQTAAVADALVLNVNGWGAVLPVAEIPALTERLRDQPDETGIVATFAATILEAFAAGEATRDLTLAPPEEAAVRSVLSSMRLDGEATGALHDLYYALACD